MIIDRGVVYRVADLPLWQRQAPGAVNEKFVSRAASEEFYAVERAAWERYHQEVNAAFERAV